MTTGLFWKCYVHYISFSIQVCSSSFIFVSTCAPWQHGRTYLLCMKNTYLYFVLSTSLHCRITAIDSCLFRCHRFLFYSFQLLEVIVPELGHVPATWMQYVKKINVNVMRNLQKRMTFALWVIPYSTVDF
jgi:hypothetical protein